MEFTFTDEQRMMASAFRRVADDMGSPAGPVGAHGETVLDDLPGAAHDDAWQKLVGLGLAGVLAPQSVGGLGLTETDFILIAEESGRAARAQALIEHAGIAVPMLADLADRSRAAEILPLAASGAARVALGHPVNPFVLGAAQADYLLLPRGDEVHLLETRHVGLTPLRSIDPGRQLFEVDWLATEVTRVVGGAAGRDAWRQALERGALYAAAQLLGSCQRMIDLAVAYARERRQFGKPIGSYQAIQHALANARVKLEFARPVVYYAATRVGGPNPRARAAVSHAKIAATDAADLAARTAMQVYGAMGYSWEVDLHFHMKRAWALAGAWGDRSFHFHRVASLVLESPLDLGPGTTFD